MKSSFAKDLFAVLQSRVAVIILSLATSAITARYLGPAGNGTIAALMVYPNLFMTVGSLGIRQSTTYFVGQEKYDIGTIYSSVLSLWLFTSLFCAICCFFLISFSTKTNYSPDLIVLAIMSIPFSLYTTYTSGIFLGKQNIREFNRINWLPAAINLVFTYLFIVVLSYGVKGSMFATFLGVFLLSIAVFFKIRKAIPLKFKWDFKMIKEMLSLGIVYAVSLLIISLNYKVDIVLLEKLSTAYEIGIYSKGAVIVEYLWQIPMLLSTLIFSRSAGAKNPLEFSIKTCRLLRFAMVGIFVASVILYFAAPIIINIMYGNAFERSNMILRILMPGVLLLTIFKVLNMDVAGKGKPWLSMKAMIPAVIINIILNFLLIPKYGADGSALSSTVSYSFAAVTFLFLYSKEVGLGMKTILYFDKEDKALALNFLQTVHRKLSKQRN